MNRLEHKKTSAKRRIIRARARLHGTAARPRLSVNVSNLHISAQLIDDDTGQTVAYATSVGQKLSGSLGEKAAMVGAEVAKKAKKAKVSKAVFDRGANKYHGRIKVLADAARTEGLEF